MSTAIRRALYGKLAGDTTLNSLLGAAATGYTKAIYHQTAPAGAPYPLVIFQKSSGNPDDAFGKPEAFKRDVWLVKAIDRNTSADTAEAIDDRIKTLLNDAVLTISGVTLTLLRRESDVEYPETADGEQFKHVGGLYRLVTT